MMLLATVQRIIICRVHSLNILETAYSSQRAKAFCREKDPAPGAFPLRLLSFVAIYRRRYRNKYIWGWYIFGMYSASVCVLG